MLLSQRRATRPRTLVKVTVALISLACILLALELSSRVALRLLSGVASPVAFSFEDPNPIVVSRRAAAAGASPLVEHPRWLWRNQSGVDVTIPVNPRPYASSPSWTIRTDAAGLRKHGTRAAQDTQEIQDGSLSASEVVYTILCAGDSSTFGFNVDGEETYPRALEKLLRERHPDVNIRVVNGGVPGWTWVQGATFLEDFGLHLEPDAVIASYGTNDRFWATWRTDREYLDHLADPRYALDRALSRLGGVRLAKRLFGGTASDWTHEPSPGCRRQLEVQEYCHRVDPAEIVESVRRFDRLTEAHGMDLVLLNSDHLGTGAAKPLRGVAASDRLRLLDAVAELHRQRVQANVVAAAERGLEPARMPTGIRYDPDDPDVHLQPRKILLRVADAPAELPLRVKGGKLYNPGDFGDDFHFDEKMYDDGTHGDEVAGDGVRSQVIWVPHTATNLRYRYYAGGEPEFEPLPPLASISAGRSVTFTRNSIGWIDRFGERFMMADRAHPNASGHAAVAGMLVPLIERLPTFEAFLAARTIDSLRAPPE